MKSSGTLTLLLLLGAFIALQPEAARAQKGSIDTNGNFGIGVMVGEPTGISVKNWLSGSTAFGIGAAWSLSDEEALHLHADYLMHCWFADAEGLAFYYGIGGRVIFADDPKVGVRVPLGLNYVFTNVPFDLFVEAVPILDLTPDTEFGGNGAVGIRYYF